jgi:predicted dinucleotide-binding enzyme
MRIGILGSGLMGGKLGTLFARAGHDVVFSYARSKQKLEKLAREAGGKARAGTPREAAQDADALLLAVHWLRFDDVVKQAGELSGKVVLSCSLPMNEDDTELVVGRTSSGAEELARKIPRARVVYAFNTVPSEVLFDVYEAKRKASRPSLVYCGDDAGAKKVAVRLIRHRALHRAFRAARRAVGVRGERRARACLPVPALLNSGTEPEPGC